MPREGAFAISNFSQALDPATQDVFLSVDLRERTAALHRRTEALLGLPGAISCVDGYAAWLGRFLGLYDPLERALATFSDWPRLSLQPHSQSARISRDLAAMGVNANTPPRAGPGMLPKLPTFSHAVGAFYVIEGARLGGRIILRDLDDRLGVDIAGARSFFGGPGNAPSPAWNQVRAALDRFGGGRPKTREDVVAGAERTFEAIMDWFRPFLAAPTVAS